MNQIERAAQAAVEAASAAAPPVAEVEARAGRVRRGRVLRVGATAAVVVLAVVAGSVAVLASGDDGRTVDTAGEVDDEPVRLSVVFPEGASEERERAVLEARLVALGAPFTVAGEWPALMATVGGFTEEEVAWVVGTPGELAVVVASPDAELWCPWDSVGSAGAAIESEIDELDERIEELDGRIAESGGASTATEQEVLLERASLLAERADLRKQIRDLHAEAIESADASLPGWPPLGTSCSEGIAAAEADGSAEVERVLPSPADAPDVVADAEGIVTVDVGETALSGAPGDGGAELFVDGWPAGVRASRAAGGEPTRFTLGVDAREASLLAAVLSGGYEAPPALTPGGPRPESPASEPPGTTPTTANSVAAGSDGGPGERQWDLRATVTVGSNPDAGVDGATPPDPVRVIGQRLSTVAAGPSEVLLADDGTVEVYANGLTVDELRALLEPSEGLVVLPPQDTVDVDENVGDPDGSVLGHDALCGDPGPWPFGQAAMPCSGAPTEDTHGAHLLYPGPFVSEVADGGVAVEVRPDELRVIMSVETVLLDGRRLSPPRELDATHLLFPGYSGPEALLLVAVLSAGPLEVVDVVVE